MSQRTTFGAYGTVFPSRASGCKNTITPRRPAQGTEGVEVPEGCDGERDTGRPGCLARGCRCGSVRAESRYRFVITDPAFVIAVSPAKMSEDSLTPCCLRCTTRS